MSVDAHDAIIVIPARRHSTRLPEKLLLSETGKPLLRHTIERALDAVEVLGASAVAAQRRVWVACDDDALAKVAADAGVGVVMVTRPCESGTERIVFALDSLPECRVVLNLQADEPEMPSDWIVECMQSFHITGGPDVATVAVPIEANDPRLDESNVVKVVRDHQGNALYFSRSTIPHVRKGGVAPTPRALQHLGLYAYTTDFLRGYSSLPESDLERSECLEQLRFLQAGAKVKVLVKTRSGPPIVGIDTPDDYRAFCQRQKPGASADYW